MSTKSLAPSLKAPNASTTKGVKLPPSLGVAESAVAAHAQEQHCLLHAEAVVQ